MVDANIYRNLPYYVRLGDSQNNKIVQHICDQGIQPQYDQMFAVLRFLDETLNPEALASNQFLDTIAYYLGLINYEDHWLGIGLNPDWDFAKKREVIVNIFDYWRKKGTVAAIEQALQIWGIDNENGSLSYNFFPEVVLDNTSYHRGGKVGLWSYLTPFNYNNWTSIAVARRLGIGDRWELRRDYVEDVDIKKLQTNLVWDGITEIATDEFHFDDNFSLADNYQLTPIFQIKNILISFDFITVEISRKLIKQSVLVPDPIPPLSSLQRTGSWDKNLLINFEFQRQAGEDISAQWRQLNNRSSSILRENLNVDITPRIIYHCQTNVLTYQVQKNEPTATLIGDIGTDYPQMLVFYDANQYRLILITSNSERTLEPANVYWRNDIGESNYYLGDHVLGTNPAAYEFPTGVYNHLIVEFNLISTLDDLEEIHEWTLNSGSEQLEYMVFAEPLIFKPAETMYLTFDITINLTP